MPTAIDVVREFFPNATDTEAEIILWEHTGFPGFWPDHTKTPEENLRQQLRAFAGEVTLLDSADKPDVVDHGSEAGR